MAKQLTFSEEARAAMKRGIDTMADTVGVTLGPRGRNVVLDKKFGPPQVCSDGVTIAKEIELEDAFENMGAQLLKEAASKTNDVAGDGTTTATVLAQAIIHEGFKNIAAGANPMAKSDHLVHNAILGNHYSKVVLGLQKPRIGLLSIGPEENKGNELTYETNKFLKKLNGPNLNYCGMIEGLQVFENSVDVVVCDGFIGNILLKTCEGLFGMIQNFLKEEIGKNPIRLAGAILAQGAFKKVKRRLDPEKYAGAPLLGLRGHVLKAHGASTSKYIISAIRIASQIVHYDLISHTTDDIEWANQIIRPHEAKPPTTS